VKPIGAKACTKPKANRVVKKLCAKERYKHRNVIERFFGALKRFRRVATRFEMKAAYFAGFLPLVAQLKKLL
jgi:putative transposase